MSRAARLMAVHARRPRVVSMHRRGRSPRATSTPTGHGGRCRSCLRRRRQPRCRGPARRVTKATRDASWSAASICLAEDTPALPFPTPPPTHRPIVLPHEKELRSYAAACRRPAPSRGPQRDDPRADAHQIVRRRAADPVIRGMERPTGGARRRKNSLHRSALSGECARLAVPQTIANMHISAGPCARGVSLQDHRAVCGTPNKKPAAARV